MNTKEFISSYLVKQYIYTDPVLQKRYLLNDGDATEHEIHLNKNHYIHLAKVDNHTIVKLYKQNPQAFITIGTFHNDNGVDEKMVHIINFINDHLFNCIMSDLNLAHLLNKDHCCTEEDYNRLSALIGKDVVIKIKTKQWNSWCLGLIKLLKDKFIKGELLQDVKVNLI